MSWPALTTIQGQNKISVNPANVCSIREPIYPGGATSIMLVDGSLWDVEENFDEVVKLLSPSPAKDLLELSQEIEENRNRPLTTSEPNLY